MVTLGDTLDPNGPIAKIIAKSPVGPDGVTVNPEYVSYINQAARKLLRRGDFPGTVVPIFVCVRQGCVVWPRYVESVRKLNMCNRDISVRNLWYRFMEHDRGCSDWPSSMRGWLGQTLSGLFDEGTTSVTQDIMGDGRLIRVYARCQNDLGKTITFYGEDNNGQVIMTRDANDNWSEGVTLTLKMPFASTTEYVRKIYYVIKESTQCPVDVYAYNASQNVLEDIAHYEGSETKPTYQKTKLSVAMGGPWSCGAGSTPNCCATLKGVMALVKLRHIPASNPDDLIVPPNEDALEDMIQSIKFKEKGDMVNSMAFEASALRELNRDSENVSPEDVLSTNDLTVGTRGFTNSQF